MSFHGGRKLLTDPSHRKVRHVRIGGIFTACVSLGDIISLMLSEAPRILERAERPWLIFDTNGHGISLAARDLDFRSALEQADVVHADGAAVVLASRIVGGPRIPDRSSTTDIYLDSIASAAAAGVTMFLLGGKPGVAEACAERSRSLAPGLQIVGTHHGYFSEGDEARVIDEINALKPDILWVGLGKPSEQAFCLKNRDAIRCGWMVTCGGLYNYLTGGYPRAPRWMQKIGLEWAHRLMTNPRHLLWRYLTTNPHAIWLMITRSGEARA